MKYTNRVAEYRKAIGKTQTQLAVEVGVSDTSIQNIEYGDNAPNIYLAHKIAKSLKSDVEKVFPENIAEWEGI